MLLKPLNTDGSLAGTGTLQCESRIMGGVLISTDATNAAVVIVRKDNSNGDQVFDLSTKTPCFITGPISLGSSQKLYYDVSGTGASAQFFEWVE